MSIKDDGGHAFPRAAVELDQGVQNGMTLRDYFAAKAMQIVWDAYDQGYSGDSGNFKDLAEGAYQFADAMLAERAK